MIVILDDEMPVAQVLVRALRRAGLEAAGYSSPEEALAALERREPALIVSDVMMPEMDGHAFRQLYRGRFPQRRTPFVFLSALADADSVIRGLDDGADDYLTKPIEASIFVAKVKALLRRAAQSGPATFRGSRAELSFVQVLQFCERRGLTGELRIRTAEGQVALSFDSGDVQLDGPDGDAALAQLMDADDGEFSVVSRPISFEELGVAERAPTMPARSAEPNPMGLLSGVRLGERLLQVQTEYERAPVSQVVTTVIHEGRVLTQRQTPPEPGASNVEITRLIEQQHAALEQQIRDRAETLSQRRGEPAEGAGRTKEQYLEQGLAHYRSGDLESAKALLAEAVATFPDDRLLQANLNIVAAKLSS